MPFEKINRNLPLRIDRWNYNDPVLHFGGGDHYVNILADWRIFKAGIIIDSSDILSGKADLDIIGSELVKVEKSGNHIVDPVFYFSSGHILEVFTMDMDEESWLIHFKKLVLLESFDQSLLQSE